MKQPVFSTLPKHNWTISYRDYPNLWLIVSILEDISIWNCISSRKKMFMLLWIRWNCIAILCKGKFMLGIVMYRLYRELWLNLKIPLNMLLDNLYPLVLRDSPHILLPTVLRLLLRKLLRLMVLPTTKRPTLVSSRSSPSPSSLESCLVILVTDPSSSLSVATLSSGFLRTLKIWCSRWSDRIDTYWL